MQIKFTKEELKAGAVYLNRCDDIVRAIDPKQVATDFVVSLEEALNCYLGKIIESASTKVVEVKFTLMGSLIIDIDEITMVKLLEMYADFAGMIYRPICNIINECLTLKGLAKDFKKNLDSIADPEE